MTVVPIDVVEVIKAVFIGIAALASAFAGVYAAVSASRSRRAEINAAAAKIASEAAHGALEVVKTDVLRIERNTNSLTTQLQAASKVEGRAEKAAEIALTDPPRTIVIETGQARSASASTPLPVADTRTATASERSATAAERSADAAEKK